MHLHLWISINFPLPQPSFLPWPSCTCTCTLYMCRYTCIHQCSHFPFEFLFTSCRREQPFLPHRPLFTRQHSPVQVLRKGKSSEFNQKYIWHEKTQCLSNPSCRIVLFSLAGISRSHKTMMRPPYPLSKRVIKTNKQISKQENKQVSIPRSHKTMRRPHPLSKSILQPNKMSFLHWYIYKLYIYIHI